MRIVSLKFYSGLPLGSRGRGLILSLYWSLEVAPKLVLQPQRPTGRSEFETCNTSMSRTSIDAYSQLEVLFQRVLKFSVACLPDVSYSCVFLM